MAFTFTVSGSTKMGKYRAVNGTFTTASGDTSGSIAPATHGLNHLVFYDMKLTGGLNVGMPKLTESSGTVTGLWDDTEGYSGTFFLIGN